jgi:hypothetical protein
VYIDSPDRTSQASTNDGASINSYGAAHPYIYARPHFAVADRDPALLYSPQPQSSQAASILVNPHLSEPRNFAPRTSRHVTAIAPPPKFDLGLYESILNQTQTYGGIDRDAFSSQAQGCYAESHVNPRKPQSHGDDHDSLSSQSQNSVEDNSNSSRLQSNEVQPGDFSQLQNDGEDHGNPNCAQVHEADHVSLPQLQNFGEYHGILSQSQHQGPYPHDHLAQPQDHEMANAQHANTFGARQAELLEDTHANAHQMPYGAQYPVPVPIAGPPAALDALPKAPNGDLTVAVSRVRQPVPHEIRIQRSSLLNSLTDGPTGIPTIRAALHEKVFPFVESAKQCQPAYHGVIKLKNVSICAPPFGTLLSDLLPRDLKT